jgi:hypothetical protein
MEQMVLMKIYIQINQGNSGTVGHGLGQKPACIIVKSRQSVNNWVVVHQGLGSMSGNVLVLNSTGAASGGGAGQVEPTANVFTITSGLAANDDNIGYVFAEKQGFSKFGSYTGNGSSDGPFVYTGFRPEYLLLQVIVNLLLMLIGEILIWILFLMVLRLEVLAILEQMVELIVLSTWHLQKIL